MIVLVTNLDSRKQLVAPQAVRMHVNRNPCHRPNTAPAHIFCSKEKKCLFSILVKNTRSNEQEISLGKDWIFNVG